MGVSMCKLNFALSLDVNMMCYGTANSHYPHFSRLLAKLFDVFSVKWVSPSSLECFNFSCHWGFDRRIRRKGYLYSFFFPGLWVLWLDKRLLFPSFASFGEMWTFWHLLGLRCMSILEIFLWLCCKEIGLYPLLKLAFSFYSFVSSSRFFLFFSGRYVILLSCSRISLLLIEVRDCRYKLGFCPNGPDCRYRHAKQSGPPPPVEEVLQKIQQLHSYAYGSSNKFYQQRNAASQQTDKSMFSQGPNVINQGAVAKPSTMESGNTQHQQQQQQQQPQQQQGQQSQQQLSQTQIQIPPSGPPNQANRTALPLPQGVSRCVQSPVVFNWVL